MAVLAVLGTTAPVRESATEVLRSRAPREFAAMLVDQIHAPMRYQVEPVRGPGSPGALLIETPRFKMLRTYDAPPVFQPGTNFLAWIYPLHSGKAFGRAGTILCVFGVGLFGLPLLGILLWLTRSPKRSVRVPVRREI